MHISDIEQYILDNFDEVNPMDSWGERSFFLNPGNQFKRGTYFATLKARDGDNDQASYLNREGVFRLSMGVSKVCYQDRFQSIPARPAKGGIIEGEYDFQKLDCLLPHPVYGWMGWVCVLSPSMETFSECKTLMDVAYQKALKITMKKCAKS